MKSPPGDIVFIHDTIKMIKFVFFHWKLKSVKNENDRPCRALSRKLFNFIGKYTWVNQKKLIKKLIKHKLNSHFLIINFLESNEEGVQSIELVEPNLESVLEP
jgi:hypothetical protein